MAGLRGGLGVLSLNEFLGLRWATLADKYIFTTLTGKHHLSASTEFYPWKLGNASKIEYMNHLLEILVGP